MEMYVFSLAKALLSIVSIDPAIGVFGFPKKEMPQNKQKGRGV